MPKHARELLAHLLAIPRPDEPALARIAARGDGIPKALLALAEYTHTQTLAECADELDKPGLLERLDAAVGDPEMSLISAFRSSWTRLSSSAQHLLTHLPQTTDGQQITPSACGQNHAQLRELGQINLLIPRTDGSYHLPPLVRQYALQASTTGSRTPPEQEVEPVADQINTSTPSVARVYNAMCGGPLHFQADRDMMDRLLATGPDMQRTVQLNREWLAARTRYLATEAGIDQFLDIGSGLPAQENTHEVAQRHNPGAVVVYSDNDPIVEVEASTLLADDHQTHFVAGDIRQPRDLLAHPITRNLDFGRPIGLILGLVLNHVDDDRLARECMETYVNALPSGSCVVMSHFHTPDAREYPEANRRALEVERLLQNGSMSGKARSYDGVAALLPGLELLDPGATFPHEWDNEWRNENIGNELGDFTVLCAVGRKP